MVAFIQQCGAANNATGPSFTMHPTANVAAGHTIFLGAKISANGFISSMSDTQGNTWVTGLNAGATVGAEANVCYCVLSKALATTDTITVNVSNSNASIGVVMAEFMGFAPGTVSTIRDTATGAGNGAAAGTGTTAISCTSGTSTQAYELDISVLAYAGTGATGDLFAVSAGWNKVNSNNDLVCLAYQIVNTIGTTSITWTTPSNGANRSIKLDGYKPYPISRLAAMGVG